MAENAFSPASAAIDTELSQVLIALLKGVVYRDQDPAIWSAVCRLRVQAVHHLSALGLSLMLDESEGYAFLKSRATVQGEEDSVPRLVARRPLTFYDSLLLALLRKRLAEFERSGAESRLTLQVEQIVELLNLFLPEHTDEVKLRERVQASIARLQEMGFLRKLKTTGDADTFEVLRILKAFVDAQWLNGFESGLAAYRTHLESGQTT